MKALCRAMFIVSLATLLVALSFIPNFIAYDDESMLYLHEGENSFMIETLLENTPLITWEFVEGSVYVTIRIRDFSWLVY